MHTYTCTHIHNIHWSNRILAGVWETTLQSLGTLLSTLHKRASIIFSPQQFHGILEEISDFFHAKGQGLSVESRHTQNYKVSRCGK